MAERDRLATELSALRTTLRVRPPGVEAVVRTVVRRRRRRRIAVVITAIVALAAISSAAFGLPTMPDRPDVTTSQSPTSAPSASPSATPTGSIAGAPSPSSPVHTRPAADPEPTGCQPESGAAMMGNADLSDVAIFSWPQFFCPGEQIEVSWATYSVDTSGTQHLEGSSQILIIDADTSTVNTSVVLPQACTYWVYFLQNANIPSTIPSNANLANGGPFHRTGSVAPSGIFDRFTGSNCESMTPVLPHRP